MEKTLDIYDGRYSANTKGDIFSSNYRNSGKRQKLKQHISGNGYLKVHLCHSVKDRDLHLVHRLIAWCFIPEIKGKNCVNHINEIKTDNRVENLEWCTYQENWQHSHGDKYGEDTPNSKLTNKQAEEIREQRNNGVSRVELVKKYDVSTTVIHNIINNKTYYKNINNHETI